MRHQHAGRWRSLYHYRFLILFLTLVAAVLVPPWFEGLELLGKAWGLMFSLVMISALYSLTGAERVTGLLILLLVPSFLMTWAAQLTEAHWADYADNGTSILYLSLVAYLLARFVATAPQVTSNVIYAAMCLYLVIAFIWGAIYSTLYLFNPASFAFSSPALQAMAAAPGTTASVFNYASFVTLTTLGYGDVLPLTRVAQSWVAIEATAGQLYIAIVIARLVGLHGSH